MEQSLRTCSNEELRRNALETVSFSAVLRKKGKQTLSDTGGTRKRTACDALLQSLPYHRLLSRGLDRGDNEIGGRGHDVEVVWESI